MMNCDQVFDILTRGPFPTGAASDRQVEAHLSQCATCQRLAEALRPAVELFQEAVLPDETTNLPGYRGPWFAALSDEEADEPNARPTPRIQPFANSAHTGSASPVTSAAAESEPARHWSTAALAMATALVVGLAVGIMVTEWWEHDHLPERVDAAVPPLAAFGSRATVPLALFQSLELPAACLPQVRRLASATAPAVNVLALGPAEARQELICCSSCHRDGGDFEMSPQGLSRLIHGCGVCHKP